MLTNRKDNRNLKIGKKITNLTSKLLQKLEIVRMQNFQYTFQTRKQFAWLYLEEELNMMEDLVWRKRETSWIFASKETGKIWKMKQSKQAIKKVNKKEKKGRSENTV